MTELDGYAQDIKACVELYYQLFDPDQSSFSDSEKIELHRLNRLAGHGLRLFTLIAMQTVNDIEKRLTLLGTLERFTFLSRIKPYSFRELDIDQISLKLKAKRLSVQEAVRLLENTCKVFLDSPEFTDAVRTIGKSDGYYGWSGLRYFMYEYEQYLRTRSKADREMLSWEEFTSEDFDSDHKSIEHIYPQKMVDPYWKERFSKYSLSERNVLRHSLGNLLPISSAKNSSLGNKSFPLKRGSIESQVGYMYGCLSEVQVSQQLDWNALTIAARGISLLEFMEKRWNLTLGTDEKKLELLGLGFVLNREGVDIVKLRDSFLTAVKKLEPKISRKA